MEITDLLALGKLPGISLGHINIRSLFGKLEDIIRILDLGSLCILGISETWLNTSVSDQMINIPGYDLYRGDRTANSGKTTGGGVCFYIKSRYNIVEHADMTLCSPNLEIIWVQLLLKDTRPTFIACTYRPPSGCIDMGLDIIEEQILDLRTKYNVCDIIVIGDYNIDTLKCRSSDSKKLVEFRNRMSPKSLIKEPTYFQRGYHSSLDDILVSNPDYYNIAGTVNTGDTDHALLFTTRKKKKVSSEPCYFYERTYTRFDPLLFQRDCIFVNWYPILSQNDPVIAWDLFLQQLHSLLDKHAPYKKMKITEDLPPWMTGEYMELSNDRDYWIDKARKSNDPVDEITCKDHNFRARRLKKNLKRDFFKLALTEAKGDSAKVWQVFEKAFSSTTQKKTKIILNGIEDPAENADVLNKFFVEIGPTLDRALGDDNDIVTESVIECQPLTLQL